MSGERWLNLELADSTGAPLAERPYALDWPDGSHTEGRTDAEGRLTVQAPVGAQIAVLTFQYRRIELVLESLPPPDTVEGAQTRLNQLNFFTGAVDGDLGPMTRGALRSFQRRHALTETGALDAATADRLEQEHGT